MSNPGPAARSLLMQNAQVRTRPRTAYADSDGVSIAYQVLGHGPPDLVFVAGWLSHLDVMWSDAGYRRFIERLAGFARLVTFDKRGVGLSDRLPPQTMPPLEERIDDLRAVMTAVGSSRAYLLAVHEAGPMCLLLAAVHPELVEGLILYGTWAAGTRSDDYRWAPSLEDHARLVHAINNRWGSGIGISNYAPSLRGDPAFREWMGQAERSGATPSTARALVEIMAATDVRHVLEAVRVPTLVLHRATDRMVDPRNGRYLADHIAGAQYVELPSGDHWLGVDPDQIVDVVEEFVTGFSPAVEAERILATVLFTDIEGSSAIGASLGDHRMRQLLDRHDELAAELVSSHHGRLVKSVGDGVLAVFDGPARGVNCALAFANTVHLHTGLVVRAGLHVGEIEARGDDITGTAVNIAARVVAAASGGEVLVSRTIVDLVAGSGLRFKERGSHELKGVPGQWQLFEAMP